MTPIHNAPIVGIPHVSSADDIHDGYFIPKGAIVFQNLWFVIYCLIFLAHGPGFAIGVRLMSHDPEVYKNPMEFAPMRFLGPNAEQDVREYCFGFGRRLVSFSACLHVAKADGGILSYCSECAPAGTWRMHLCGSLACAYLRFSISRHLWGSMGDLKCRM